MKFPSARFTSTAAVLVGVSMMINASLVAATPQDGSMANRAEKEVVDLHQFFEDWFNGKLDNNETEFDRFDAVMAADFEIINPAGVSSSRAGIIDRLQGSHGFQSGATEPMRIWIENVRSRALSGELHLVTYEEWQETEGVTRGRLSTAIFSNKAGTPNGVQWHHVHETWLPEDD